MEQLLWQQLPRIREHASDRITSWHLIGKYQYIDLSYYCLLRVLLPD